MYVLEPRDLKYFLCDEFSLEQLKRIYNKSNGKVSIIKAMERFELKLKVGLYIFLAISMNNMYDFSIN